MTHLKIYLDQRIDVSSNYLKLTIHAITLGPLVIDFHFVRTLSDWSKYNVKLLNARPLIDVEINKVCINKAALKYN